MPTPSYVWFKDDQGGDIKGSVQVGGREGSCEVMEFLHDLHIPTDPHTGKLTGVRMHSPIKLIKSYDAASPYLYKACCEGQTLKEVTVKWYAIDDTGAEKEYFIHKLEDVKVAAMKAHMPNTKDRLAKNNVKWTEQAFKIRLMEIVNLTEQTYYELIATRELVIAQQKAVELAERLLPENKKRVEVGAMAPLDEKQAESQGASSRSDLLVAKNAVAVREDLLKSYITDEYAKYANVKIVPSESLKAPRQFFDRQDSWSKGLSYRPDYAQAKRDLESAGIQIKYTKNQLLPQVDI